MHGERPSLIHWGVSTQTASANMWKQQENELEKIRQQYKDDPEKLTRELERQAAEFQERRNGVHYKNLSTGQTSDIWRPLQR